MKSKRNDESLKSQIKWAEKIKDEDIKMMLVDGKSKTSCGCTVIDEQRCPHGNMGALQLLMLQLSDEELEALRKEAEEKE